MCIQKKTLLPADKSGTCGEIGSNGKLTAVVSYSLILTHSFSMKHERILTGAFEVNTAILTLPRLFVGTFHGATWHLWTSVGRSSFLFRFLLWVKDLLFYRLHRKKLKFVWYAIRSFIPEAYITCEACIMPSGISPATAGSGYHWKNHFCLPTRVVFRMAPRRGVEPLFSPWEGDVLGH